MKYPNLLQPNSIEEIKTSSGRLFMIPKVRTSFRSWAGDPIADTNGNKPILELSGKPYYAELALLKLAQDSGWQGVWIDTFSNVYRTHYWPKNRISLPPKQEILLQSIFSNAGSTKGCWDVYIWNEDDVLFC